MAERYQFDPNATSSSQGSFVLTPDMRSRVTEAPIVLQTPDVTIRGIEPLPKPGSQAYFWLVSWQLDEGRAEREREAGQGVVFEDVEDAIGWLNRPDH